MFSWDTTLGFSCFLVSKPVNGWDTSFGEQKDVLNEVSSPGWFYQQDHGSIYTLWGKRCSGGRLDSLQCSSQNSGCVLKPQWKTSCERWNRAYNAKQINDFIRMFEKKKQSMIVLASTYMFQVAIQTIVYPGENGSHTFDKPWHSSVSSDSQIWHLVNGCKCSMRTDGPCESMRLAGNVLYTSGLSPVQW